MNWIKCCAFTVVLGAILAPLEGSGATCSSYSRITNAGAIGVWDGVVEGYEDSASGVVIVRFASVTAGNAYTCKEVRSWRYGASEQAEQDRLNDQVRKAAILSMSLGYVFNGYTNVQSGEPFLLGACLAVAIGELCFRSRQLHP